MTASHLLRWLSRILHVLKTYGTALLQSLLDARVSFLHYDREAALTHITVEHVVFPSNPTDHALFAMEYLLLVAHIVIKCADFAVIHGKPLVAFSASIRFRLLLTTSQAFNVSCFIAVILMVNLWVNLGVEHHLIVAKSTAIKLPLANRIGALNTASPFVVFAT